MDAQHFSRYQSSSLPTAQEGNRNGNRQPFEGQATTQMEHEELSNIVEDRYLENASCKSDENPPSYWEDSGAEVPDGIRGIPCVTDDHDIDDDDDDWSSTSESLDDLPLGMTTSVVPKRGCEVGSLDDSEMHSLSGDDYNGDVDDESDDDDDDDEDIDCVLFSSSLRSDTGNFSTPRAAGRHPELDPRQASEPPSSAHRGTRSQVHTTTEHSTLDPEYGSEISELDHYWSGDGVSIDDNDSSVDETPSSSSRGDGSEENISTNDSVNQDYLEAQSSDDEWTDEVEEGDDVQEEVLTLDDNLTSTTSELDLLEEVAEAPRPVNFVLLDHYEHVARNTHASEDAIRKVEEEKEQARLEMEKWFPGSSFERMYGHDEDAGSSTKMARDWEKPTIKSFDPEVIHEHVCNYLYVNEMHGHERGAFFAFLNALGCMEYTDYEDASFSSDEEDDSLGVAWPSSFIEKRTSIRRFLRYWFVCCPRACSVRQIERKTGRSIPDILNISMESLRTRKWKRPPKISVPDNPQAAEGSDIQGIPWEEKLGVSRRDARGLRDMFYQAFHNEPFEPFEDAVVLPSNESFFRPKALYTRYKPSIGHLQLRNMLSVVGAGVVQYADPYGVKSVIPFYGADQTAMSLDKVPDEHRSPFRREIRISTMSSKHGVTIFGGLNGEWGYCGNNVEPGSMITGIIHANPLISHINLHLSRTSDTPRALMAGNSTRLHELDLHTGQIVTGHETPFGVNCTALSPSGTSCLIAGDNKTPYILDTATMKPMHGLAGHRDYVFGCDFSPDGYHVATAAQDLTVAIWDVRTMRIIRRIACDVSNCYSVQFSPPTSGRGKRSLILAESGDRVSFVAADNGLYDSRQVIDFFGEISGCGFSPDGQKAWVANADPDFGGLMEFERIDDGTHGFDQDSFLYF